MMPTPPPDDPLADMERLCGPLPPETKIALIDRIAERQAELEKSRLARALDFGLSPDQVAEHDAREPRTEAHIVNEGDD
jgi:hypothetical protein